MIAGAIHTAINTFLDFLLLTLLTSLDKESITIYYSVQLKEKRRNVECSSPLFFTDHHSFRRWLPLFLWWSSLVTYLFDSFWPFFNRCFSSHDTINCLIKLFTNICPWNWIGRSKCTHCWENISFFINAIINFFFLI